MVTLADAGNVDAGSTPDAGADGTDAGMVLDAGQEPSDAGTACVVDAGLSDEPCEGDEDFCRPYDGSAPPGSFIAAAWSRVEGGAFLLEVRFASLPFVTGHDQTLVIGLEEDANPSDGNDGVELFVNGGTEEIVFDRVVGLSNGVPNGDVYPPADYSFTTDVSEAPKVLDPCSIGFSRQGLVYRFTLTRDPPYQEAPSYVLLSDDATGATVAAAHSESPGVPSLVQSEGGAANAQGFVSLCAARCPTLSHD